MRSKFAIIVGARPQFIKIALLTNELKKQVDIILIHTGQHYDYELSESFFDQMKIPNPDYNLNVGSGKHGYQTGEMLKKIEEVFIIERIDVAIVVGDTNSTLAGALAASKLDIKLVHIEAGMRNFDRKKPEEINRILTDHITDIFFAATENAKKNLNAEGIKEKIFIVGDISNDVFLKAVELCESRSDIIEKLGLTKGEYMVLTIHKSKNTDSKKNLTAILRAVFELEEKIVFPIHPRTKMCIEEYGLNDILKKDNLIITKPLTYFDMIKLMKYSQKIITDSGGIQKEAYALKKPCITMRKTEWIETLEGAWNVEANIHDKEVFINLIKEHQPTGEQTDFLGNGDTYKKIAKLIWKEKL